MLRRCVFFFTHTWRAAEGVSPAAEMAITHLKMDFRLSEMRPLSLMRRQITAAKVVDGDQMEAEAQVSLPEAGLDGDPPGFNEA